MKLTESTIIRACHPSAFQKGKAILKEGKVGTPTVSWKRASSDVLISGNVEGGAGESYKVKVGMEMRREKTARLMTYGCNCPAFQAYSGPCKHCAAVMLWFLQEQDKFIQVEEKPEDQPEDPWKDQLEAKPKLKALPKVQKEPPTSPEVKKLLRQYGVMGKSLLLGGSVFPVEASFVLSYSYLRLELELRVGRTKMYVVKSLLDFGAAVAGAEYREYGKGLAFVHDMSAFSQESAKKVAALLRVMKSRFGNFDGGRYYSPFRSLTLNPHEAQCILECCSGEEVLLNGNLVEVVEGNPDLCLTCEARAMGGVDLQFPEFQVIWGDNRLFVWIGSRIYCTTEDYAFAMEPLLKLLDSSQVVLGKRWMMKEPPNHLSRQDYAAFCGNVLPRIQEYVQVKSPDVDWQQYLPEEARIGIYLDINKTNQVTCLLKADYGSHAYNLLDLRSRADEYHDLVREEAALQVVKANFPDICQREEDSYGATSGTDEELYQLMVFGIPQMQQVGEVYISESLKGVHVLPSPRLSAGISMKGGFLEMDVQMESMDIEQIKEILAAYRLRKKFYRLKDGTFFSLHDNSIDFLGELTEGLGLLPQDWQAGKVKVPKFRASYLESVIREQGGEISINRSGEFKQMIRDMREPEDMDFPYPKGLSGELRSYQKTGYKWLKTLAWYGFGGILADEMGLGKTVQMITFLLSEEKRSLIVCPASLVYNWEYELNRFAPSLQVVTVTGTSQERQEKLRACKGSQVLVTSYDLLKRDVEHYKDMKFQHMVIDEAQYIKNMGTQAAKAVKQVDCACRFALTGTPIENRLSELWSIFDFLMPGYLFAYHRFRKELELPIVQAGDEKGIKRLQKMIRPFILRRVKKDVLKDLPDKIETVVYSRMEQEQASLYQAVMGKLLHDLSRSTPEEFQANRIQILAQLTRLRQICCSPQLCYEDYQGGSAKLDTFLELAGSMVDEGHRILVFSQFAQMLLMLRRALEDMGLKIMVLTGKDSKEARREMVAAFQRGEADIFLISLKAGGTGLNLTAADMVIHYDPWWNVAAQNQATDRTHRIGQKNRVTVIKMVTKGTIEEKILKLQEKKQELVDHVLSQDGFSSQAVTLEELRSILEA